MLMNILAAGATRLGVIEHKEKPPCTHRVLMWWFVVFVSFKHFSRDRKQHQNTVVLHVHVFMYSP